MMIRSPQEVMDRLDRMIADIRHSYHKGVIGKPKHEVNAPGDVLIVAHGHILRAFAMRWIGKELTEGVALILDGISYETPGSLLLSC